MYIYKIYLNNASAPIELKCTYDEGRRLMKNWINYLNGVKSESFILQDDSGIYFAIKLETIIAIKKEEYPCGALY